MKDPGLPGLLQLGSPSRSYYETLETRAERTTHIPSPNLLLVWKELRLQICTGHSSNQASPVLRSQTRHLAQHAFYRTHSPSTNTSYGFLSIFVAVGDVSGLTVLQYSSCFFPPHCTPLALIPTPTPTPIPPSVPSPTFGQHPSPSVSASPLPTVYKRSGKGRE